MAAYTLAELAKVETSVLRKGIIVNLLRFSDLLPLVPFTTIDALHVTITRWKTLPDVGYRKIGGGYTTDYGSTEQLEEGIGSVLGCDIDIDRIFGLVKNTLQDPLVTQTQMHLKAMAYEFNRVFVWGDPLAAGADEMMGLEYRVEHLPARQRLYLDASADGTGAALDLTPGTSQADNFLTFLDALDRALAYTDGASVILTNLDSMLLINSAMRKSTLYKVTQDKYEREIATYKGVRLIDCGLKKDQLSEIIPHDGLHESGATGTYMYLVHFGEPDGVVGVQLEPMNVRIISKELEDKPAKRIRIDWPLGLVNLGSYSIARISGFKVK